MKSDPLITYRRKPASLDAKSLESFAELLRAQVAGGHPFHCRISNDAELQALNAQFRRKDYPTDVLSFPHRPLPYGRVSENQSLLKRDREGADDGLKRDREGADDGPLGDIAISLDRARAQARQFGHSLDGELRILLLHGLLHLTGLDHESDSGRMKRTEMRWRKKLGLPVGLIERAA